MALCHKNCIFWHPAIPAHARYTDQLPQQGTQHRQRNPLHRTVRGIASWLFHVFLQQKISKPKNVHFYQVISTDHSAGICCQQSWYKREAYCRGTAIPKYLKSGGGGHIPPPGSSLDKTVWGTTPSSHRLRAEEVYHTQLKHCWFPKAVM